MIKTIMFLNYSNSLSYVSFYLDSDDNEIMAKPVHKRKYEEKYG